MLNPTECDNSHICFLVHLGCRHPDPIVESSTLSSVSPPDIHYDLHLPPEVIDSGRLSALQLEAVVYASQRHECVLPNGQRAGFLIGKILSATPSCNAFMLNYCRLLCHREYCVRALVFYNLGWRWLICASSPYACYGLAGLTC